MLDVDDETRSSVDGPVECCVCYVQRFKWDVHVAGCRCRALCQSRACFLARGAKLSRCPCVRCLSTCVDSAPGVCAGRCDGAMHMVYLKQNVSFSGFSLIVLPLPCCFELSVTVGLLAGPPLSLYEHASCGSYFSNIEFPISWQKYSRDTVLTVQESHLVCFLTPDVAEEQQDIQNQAAETPFRVCWQY